MHKWIEKDIIIFTQSRTKPIWNLICKETVALVKSCRLFWNTASSKSWQQAKRANSLIKKPCWTICFWTYSDFVSLDCIFHLWLVGVQNQFEGWGRGKTLFLDPMYVWAVCIYVCMHAWICVIHSNYFVCLFCVLQLGWWEAGFTMITVIH